MEQKKRMKKTVIIFLILILIFGVLFILQEKYDFLQNFKNVFYSKSIINHNAQVVLKIVKDKNT
ncbi:MAG: hypothetical protein NT139_02470 [Candidatus Woesearchaeota archaeon]|nr:hypothetical protein [Candidatus Woesearchaeota archaeon]